ncbi:hypothetical protein OESDEN_06335 [Oesophagostomum dentatum]|uniref:Uncharacterized protein n=1 Tax=Oesophagostomum dentatum TaxID=61180 RepID=A0A0B1TEE5_OESDE|nr:hypothetical protein OESDEN_06335 [Oesophagostomum dentatum]
MALPDVVVIIEAPKPTPTPSPPRPLEPPLSPSHSSS